MYSGKTLAHTGIAVGSVAVLGFTVPWLAFAAAGVVVIGALFLRLSNKSRATR